MHYIFEKVALFRRHVGLVDVLYLIANGDVASRLESL